jgi:hypothetical protein
VGICGRDGRVQLQLLDLPREFLGFHQVPVAGIEEERCILETASVMDWDQRSERIVLRHIRGRQGRMRRCFLRRNVELLIEMQ